MAYCERHNNHYSIDCPFCVEGRPARNHKDSRQVERTKLRKSLFKPEYSATSPYGVRAARRANSKSSKALSSKHYRKPHVNHCTKLKK